MSDEAKIPESEGDPNRRDVLGAASKAAMGAGLVAGYGTLGAMAGRFLYPAQPEELQWMYVTQVDAMEPDETLVYRTPTGETVNITRKARSGDASDFVALSSVCPHLGCQVHWESQNNRYFCPCHNGVFDPEGVGVGGPPGDARQSLPRYDVAVDGGLLFLRVRVVGLAEAGADGCEGEIVEAAQGRPGHDPCLGPRTSSKGRLA